MFKMEIVKLFAENHNITFDEANAVATPWELFDTYLRYEGIIGYTNQIITTFRECFDLDQFEYLVSICWYNEKEGINETDHIPVLANSCQQAADIVRENRTHLKYLKILKIKKNLGSSYIAVNAWK